MYLTSTWFSVDEVANFLAVSRMTIYRLVEADLIPHARIGRLIRIPSRGLETYLERGGNDPAEIEGRPEFQARRASLSLVG